MLKPKFRKTSGPCIPKGNNMWFTIGVILIFVVVFCLLGVGEGGDSWLDVFDDIEDD